MKYKNPLSLRQFCGVIIILIFITVAVSTADKSGLLPASMGGDWQPLMSVVTATILSQLHWERMVANPPEGWARLALAVVLNCLPFYLATAFAVYLIFKLTQGTFL